MKKCIIFLFLIALSINLYAQSLTVEGKVLDRQQQPIGYVSVALLADDSSTLVTGTITNDEGTFVLSGIKSGKYIISLSYIGYTPQKQEIDVIANQKLSFVLEEDDYLLGEVEITADRSQYVRQSATGKTFMLSATAIQKKDILEALQEIPTLDIDVNTRKISLADGSKPLILINGIRREGGLSSINAEDILSVDVVPTSSAEFMQQGYTSVVNIKVRKTESRYTSVNAGLYSHPLLFFGMGDAVVEFGNSKYSLYFSGEGFGFLNNKSDMEESSETQMTSRLLRYKRESDYWDMRFTAGGSRSWSDADYSSFSAGIGYIPQSSNAAGNTRLTNKTDNNVNNYIYNRQFDDKQLFGSLNLYHKHTFSGSSLELLLSMNISDNKNIANQQEEGDAGKFFTNYDFRNQRMSAYFNPGFQFRLGEFESKVGLNTYYQYNKIKRNEGAKSEFDHKEWSEYAFIDISRAWDRFSFMASVGVDWVSRDVAGHTDKYFNIRPVASMAYKFNDHHAMTINYSMQSTPPDVVELNPYNTSSDTLSISTGNPYLKPYRTHRARFAYTFTGGGFYAEPFVSFRRIDDAIVSSGATNAEGQYQQTLVNEEFSNLWSGGAILRYSIPKVGFIGFNLAYNRISFPEVNQSDDYFSGRLNWGLGYKKLYFSGIYPLAVKSYAKYQYNYSSPDSRFTLSYAISSQLDISAGMRFIFNRHHTERHINMPGYSYHYNNQFTNRGHIVMFGLRYKFQNKRTEQKPKIPVEQDKGFRLIAE